MPRYKRTKKQYEDIYRNPFAMFPGGPDSESVLLKLWPPGSCPGGPYILLMDQAGRGYRIRASRGPAGFGLQVDIVGTGTRADVSGNLGKLGEPLEGFTVKDACHLGICQYDDTESAQAHRRWYAGEAEHPDGNHTPPSGKYLIPPAKPKESFEVAPTGTADAGEAFGGNGR